MGRVLTFLAIIVAILLAGGLAVPPLMDWSHLRARLEAEGSVQLGVPVRLSGPIRLRLLPTPEFTLEEIEVDLPSRGDDGHTEQIPLKARVVLAELDWSLLTGGTPQLIGLAAEGVDIRARAIDWSALADLLEQGPGLPQRISLKEGRLLDGDDEPVIDALAGKWRRADDGETLTLKGRLNTMPLTVAGSLRPAARNEAYGADRDRILRLRMTGENAKLALRFEGGIKPGALVPEQGQWSVEAERIGDLVRVLDAAAGERRTHSTLVETLTDRLGSERMARPIAVEGLTRLAEDGVLLEDLILYVDKQRIEGRGEIKYAGATAPTVTLDLSTQTLVAAADTDEIEPLALLEAAHEALLPIRLAPAWAALKGQVTLEVQSLLWQESVLQDVTIGMDLHRGRLALADLQVGMPGGAQLTLGSTSTETDTAPESWHGTVNVHADYPRSFLSWLGLPVETLPPGVLGDLMTALSITVEDRELFVRDMAFRIGGADVKGTVRVLDRRKVTQIDLATDIRNLDLDAYRRLGQGWVEAISETGVFGDRSGDVPSIDLSFQIKGAGIRFAGRTFDDMMLEGRGALDEERARLDIIDMAGRDQNGTRIEGRLSLMGPANDNGSATRNQSVGAPRDPENLRHGSFQIHLSAPDLEGFARSLSWRMAHRLYADRLPEGPVDILFSGGFDAAQIAGTLEGTGGSIDLRGSADLRFPEAQPADWPVAGEIAVTLATPQPSELAAALGLPSIMEAEPVDPTSEPQTAEVSGEPGDEGFLKGRFLLSEGTGTAELTLDLAGTLGQATADVQIGQDDLSYDGRLDFMIPPLSDDHEMPALSWSSQVSGSSRSAEISEIELVTGASTMGGMLNLSHGPAAAPSGEEPSDVVGNGEASKPGWHLSGSLDWKDLSFDPFLEPSAAAVDGPSADAAQADGGWSLAALPLDWLDWGGAEIGLTAGTVRIGSLVFQDVTLPFVLADRRLSVEAARARVDDGTLEATFRLRRDTTGRAITHLLLRSEAVPVTLAVPRRDEDEAADRRLMGLATGTADLTSAGISLFDVMSSLAGEIEGTLNNALITPLDVSYFADVWPGIDSLNGFETALAQTANAGETRIDGLSGRVFLRDGIGRLDEVAGTVAAQPLAVQGSINLGARLMDLEALFTIPQSTASLIWRVSGAFDTLSHGLDAADLRLETALRIKETKADRLTEEDLPADVLELLKVLEEDQKKKATGND